MRSTVMRWLLAGVLAALSGTLQADMALAETQCRPEALQAQTALAAACDNRPTVSLAFVGDLLMHSPLQRQGAREGYASLWEAATPWLRAADIAVANLETATAPGITRSLTQTSDPGVVFDGWVYSSFPLFNTPPVILDAAKASGIDVLTTANNHALDRGPDGVRRTLAEIAARDLAATGTRPDASQSRFGVVVPSRIGNVYLIACSFSNNGLPDPERQLLYCYDDRTALLAEITQARRDPQTALVIALPHWGVEYSHRPTTRQSALADAMIAAGADAVIGTHAHVVQPMSVEPGPHGLTVTAFGTGNFVSNQPGLARQTGMLVWLEYCPGRSDGLSVTPPRAVLSRAGWRAFLMQRYPHRLVAATAQASGLADDAHRLVSRYAPGLDLGGEARCEAPLAPPFSVALQ